MKVPGAPFLASSFAYNLGAGCFAVALGQSLFTSTESPSAFIAVLVIEYLMPIAMGMSAGSLVDRSDPARVGAVVSGLTAATVGAYAFLLDPPAAIGIALGVGITVLRPYYRAAIFTVGPLCLAEAELRIYNARWTASVQAGQIAGAAVAGLILWSVTLPAAFVLSAAAFALAALCFLAGRAPLRAALRDREEAPVRSRRGWGTTLRKLLDDRSGKLALGLIGVDFITITAFTALLAPLVAQSFAGHTGWVGVLDALFAVGAIAGAAGCERLSAHLDVQGTASLGYAGQVAGLGGIAVSAALGPGRAAGLVAAVAAALLGAAVAVSSSQQLSALQGLADAGEMGKVGAVRQGAIGITTAGVLPLVGYLAALSLPSAFAAAAIVLVVALAVNQCVNRYQARHRRRSRPPGRHRGRAGVFTVHSGHRPARVLATSRPRIST